MRGRRQPLPVLALICNVRARVILPEGRTSYGGAAASNGWENELRYTWGVNRNPLCFSVESFEYCAACTVRWAWQNPRAHTSGNTRHSAICCTAKYHSQTVSTMVVALGTVLRCSCLCAGELARVVVYPDRVQAVRHFLVR